MADVKRIGGIGWAIDKLNEHYESGEMKGFLFQVLNNDGTFHTLRAGDLTYIEMLGLIESAKDDFRLIRSENVQ